jgi:hypothetical protein
MCRPGGVRMSGLSGGDDDMKHAACILLTLLFLSAVGAEAGTIVLVKKGRVERRDEKGAYRGTVGNSGAISAATDGVVIVILYDNGRVIRYTAEGAYKGTVGNSGATAIQVAAGQIMVTYAGGRTVRYDALTGAYKGTL